MHGKADWLTPGTFVRSPANPDWGLGQVQSVVDNKATVNFENAGKLVIRLASSTIPVTAGSLVSRSSGRMPASRARAIEILGGERSGAVKTKVVSATLSLPARSTATMRNTLLPFATETDVN